MVTSPQNVLTTTCQTQQRRADPMSLSSIMSGNPDPAPQASPISRPPTIGDTQHSSIKPSKPLRPQPSAPEKRAKGVQEPIAPKILTPTATAANASRHIVIKPMSNGHKEAINGARPTDKPSAWPKPKVMPASKPKAIRPDERAMAMAVREIENGGDLDKVVLEHEADWKQAWLRYNDERRSQDDDDERTQRKVCLSLVQENANNI